MGPNRDEFFELDIHLFESNLADVLLEETAADETNIFFAIHEAFDKSFRAAETKTRKVILYHSHNSSDRDFCSLSSSHTNSQLIYIVRDPVQSLESWLLNGLEGQQDGRSLSMRQWLSATRKFFIMINEFNSPLKTVPLVVRLEDIKENRKNYVTGSSGNGDFF